MDASQKETPTEKDGPDNQAKKKGLALIVHDLKQKRLIPIKIIFFFIVSGIGVLVPYMAIHMKSLGITVTEAAVIYGIYPIFSILAPCIVGVIADKLGNFKTGVLSVRVIYWDRISGDAGC